MSEPRISHAIPVSANTVQQIQKEARAELAMQVESEEDLTQFFELSLYNPMLMAQKFKDLKEQKSLQKEKVASEKTEGKKVLETEKADEAANRFQKNNFELLSKTLLILRSRLSEDDTADTILEKVLSFYPDPALADEALDFLLETTEGKIKEVVEEAKEKLNETRSREIVAGRNMGAQAREFSKEGLGSPTSLRDLYRDIVLNPRDPLKLFDELTDKFRYDKMHSAIHFLLHSLGSDLRAKGSSIDKAELKRLVDETRSLQGILGVFRFFLSRMGLIEKQFQKEGLILPPRLDFELLAKLFIKMLAERFINPDKILQSAKLLGISEEVAAQIIIYTQMRDAIRQVAPRYYRNRQHKEELLKSFLDALEKLEDELEEEEEKNGDENGEKEE